MKAANVPTRPVSLEIFSGNGHWSESMRRRGYFAVEVDLKHGVDASSHKFVKLVRGALAANIIDAIHFGPPCAIFSSARDRPNGPARLRSDLTPAGLPGLSAADQRKVIEGNHLADITLALARAALRLGIPGRIENPADFTHLLDAMLREVPCARLGQAADTGFLCLRNTLAQDDWNSILVRRPCPACAKVPCS